MATARPIVSVIMETAMLSVQPAMESSMLSARGRLIVKFFVRLTQPIVKTFMSPVVTSESRGRPPEQSS
jgi:hypothetical protein